MSQRGAPTRQNVMTIWGGWKCILNICNPWRHVFPVVEFGCCMAEFGHVHTISTMAWRFFMENVFFRLICLLGLAITRVSLSFSSLKYFYRIYNKWIIMNMYESLKNRSNGIWLLPDFKKVHAFSPSDDIPCRVSDTPRFQGLPFPSKPTSKGQAIDKNL